jgi:acetyl esterase
MLRVWDAYVDGREARIPVRIYYPVENRVRGIAVYYHGGGFVSGSIESADERCRHIAGNCGCTVVSVGYRLAPEHRFPAAVVDAFDALKWVYERAEELGGDKDSVCVVGVSAGGNLAAVVSILARDSGIKLRCQVLAIPVIGLDLYSESVRMYSGKDSGLDPELLLNILLQYLGDLREALNPLFTPMLANLSNLPQALIITAEKDVLRDQGETYAKRLMDSGVSVISIRINNAAHVMDDYHKKFMSMVIAAYLRSVFTNQI